MKTVRTRFKSSTISLTSMVFIYLLLSILAVLLSAQLFYQALQGDIESIPLLIIFFLIIPAVLAVFLSISLYRLIEDVLSRQAGSKFKARLLAYFIVTAFFASTPTTIISARIIITLVTTFEQEELPEALVDAQNFALDAYEYRLSTLELLGRTTLLDIAPPEDEGDMKKINKGLLAIQEFQRTETGSWVEVSRVGGAAYMLDALPATNQGFLPRQIQGDIEFIRYLALRDTTSIRLISFDLGGAFSERINRIELALSRIQSIGNLAPHLGVLLLIFFGTFSLPTLLMTMIIAVTLSSMVTQPIVNLTEATRRVAEGDFTIRIFSRPGDELGALISSFNAMVHDLEISRAAAFRTEKINLWQDMAQRLAHEIKNPLTPIKLSAERVLRRARTDPVSLSDILEPSMLAIIQEVDGLTNLLTEFRTFARLPSPTLSRTDLRSQVEETTALYRNSYPDIEFNLDLLTRGFSIKADKRHLSQVLTNLILNAIDAMEGSGTIEFSGDLVKKRDCRYCRLSIRDTGKGIPESEGSQVFTPYFTTKVTGTGLGLPIVERIILDHGGAIWFESAVGVGTTFFLDLPIDLTPEEQA